MQKFYYDVLDVNYCGGGYIYTSDFQFLNKHLSENERTIQRLNVR